MKNYQIAELEQLTGIKAHTLRIWEQRYQLIEPSRTQTGIRRYDDAQMKKILNVCTLLKSGWKISKIAALTEKQLHQELLQLEKHSSEDSIAERFINEMVEAMLVFDERLFEKSYAHAVTHFGMFDAMIRVIYPLLNKIGIMWTLDTSIPVQEHFASAIIKRKLMTAIDQLPPAKKNGKKFVLFLPPEEFHEIGLLFGNFMIRQKGHQTIYLGQNVPLENVQQINKELQPDFIFSIFTIPKENKQLAAEFKQIIKPGPRTTILLSGNPNNTEKFKGSKNLELVNTPYDLLHYL